MTATIFQMFLKYLLWSTRSPVLCVSFLGGVKENGRVVVGPRDSTEIPPHPMVQLLDGVYEVCARDTIFQGKNNTPKLHMHATFGSGSHVVTGCIRMGIDIEEIVVLEITNASAHRELDENRIRSMVLR